MSTTDEKKVDGQARPDAPGAADGPHPRNKGQAWERPVAMAKDRNVRSWLIFLGVICLAVALWTPLRVLIYRYGYKEVESAVVRDASAFVAIAYYGVDSEALPGSQDITKDAFLGQLKLLRENGYTPIRLEEVRAFYKEGKLLPRKAILMTFEQSRRSSYFEVRDLLREYKWKAVMGVNTAPIHARDAQALLWPYLQDMLTVGSWDLAAQSENGFVPIETNPAGQKGPFFANPMWLAKNNRYELPDEFNARIKADHESVIQEFQRKVALKPTAFFFPYGDYGQYDERAHVVRMSNLHLVGEHYELGFILGQLALNTSSSDPRRLNRLLVDPQWSPEMLLSKLASFWPKDDVRGLKTVGHDANAWIGEWGDVFVRNDELVLRAIPPEDPINFLNRERPNGTTGAKAWLAGSDMFEDGFLSFRFQHKRGRFGVYLRATSVGDYVYFSLDDAGKLSVRQKLPDMDELILATDALPGTGDESGHELLICLRGNLLFARLDGRMLFGGRILLGGEVKPGLVGIGVWNQLPGIAQTVILDTRISGRRDAVVTWTPEVARDFAYLSAWLNENSYQFTVFSPPWLDIFENAPMTFPVWDRKAVDLLARSNGSRVMPHVQVRDVTLLLKVPADEIVDRALEHGVDGLYVDTSACTVEQVTPLVTWMVKLNAALQAKQLPLILRLPLPIESLPTAGSIVRLLPGVILAGDYQTPPFGMKPSDVLAITSVPPPASDESVALYYQISHMFSVYNDISPEAQKEELRQKGFDAFGAGDYSEAIKFWSEWAKKDPRNAEPAALTGDARVRLNELPKALASYAESLALNPGQVGLAIRYARLLEQMNRLDESSAVLNVYARAFPDHTSIPIAQAQWLDRHRQRNEARNVMRMQVAKHPENIEARLVLQSLLDAPDERYGNMQELLDIGRRSETQLYGFGRGIFSDELLTIPEASVFFDFVRDTAQRASNKRTQELYQGFLPHTNNIVENFTANKLSDNWVALGGLRPSTYGRYELRAGSDMAEAFLRLKKSELIRDGFVDVTLDESVGSFWLYARRSSKSMIRYGYDDEGFIYIQSWLNGSLRTFESRPWLRQPGKVQLRLEVRGDGAVGYVNGKPFFTTPLSIPQEVCYGWWSIAPYSPDLGIARVRISRLACGPLAPTILLMPRLSVEETSEALSLLRERVRDLSVVAPLAFTQMQDGSIPADPEIELTPYKMFCTFHRLRLMPVVDLAYFSDSSPEFLSELILRHRLSGMILRVRSMPDEAWCREMEKTLEKTSADFIVVRQEEPYWPENGAQELLDLKKLGAAEVREIQRGSLMLHPVKDVWHVPAVPYGEWSSTLSPATRESVEPCLVVFPRNYHTVTNVSPAWADLVFKAAAKKTGAGASAGLEKTPEAAKLELSGIDTNPVPIAADFADVRNAAERRGTVFTNLFDTLRSATNRVVTPPQPSAFTNDLRARVTAFVTNANESAAGAANGSAFLHGAGDTFATEADGSVTQSFWQRLRGALIPPTGDSNGVKRTE
jgi:peptidoglycan/xylan/chitin deacetylase (PgdA/CDA1 family)/tetratricopeptide (TPR) repeat protein